MIRRWFESLSRRDQLALLVLALAIGVLALHPGGLRRVGRWAQASR